MSEEFRAIIDLLQGQVAWAFAGYLVFKLLEIILIFTGIILAVRCLLGKLIHLCHDKYKHAVEEMCRIHNISSWDSEIGSPQILELNKKQKETK